MTCFTTPRLHRALLAAALLTAVPAIPEPGTWAPTLAGLGAMGALQRRRRVER